MTASEHPSNHHPYNPRPLRPGQGHRSPKCTCDTEPEAWGCAACADRPDPIAKPLKCAAGCGADTYNVVSFICDTCAPHMAHAAKECALIDENLQAVPVLCIYCMVRSSRHWSMICDACSAMGA